MTKAQSTKHKAQKNGFTILETVVAFAILLSAVMGPVALITRSISGISDAQFEIVALNLAQEGLELVQAIRENNILCETAGEAGADWRQDYNGSPINPNLLLGTDRSIDATNVFPRTCGTASIITVSNPTLSGGCSTPLLRESSSPFRFGYLSGNPTPFTRCVTITEPASGETVGGITITTPNMLDVVVNVSWQRRLGIAKSVVLTKRLYNWR